eukprot:1245922-Ditylum_brightwellii.AAC.1
MKQIAQERFDIEMGRFHWHYCDEEAKDTMCDNLCAFQCPTKENPQDHSNCIDTFVQYSNKLPGLTPVVDVAQTKKISFDHCPEKWTTAYICAGKNLSVDALTDVTQFMSNEKTFADAKDATHSDKCPSEDKKNKNGSGKK